MSEMKPHDAKLLREAFKNTTPSEVPDGSIQCDHVWVYGAARGNNKAQCLSLEKDGKVVAYIHVTNATLKRLKGEFERWRRIGTASEGYGSTGNRQL